jgi:hypothetical protein
MRRIVPYPRSGLRGLAVSASLMAILMANETVASDRQVHAPAGYVVAFSPADAAASENPAVFVLRGGQEMPVRIGASLFESDQVVVREPSASVTIETATDHRLRVDATRSPHLVTGSLPEGGRFAELASIVAELFRPRPARASVNLMGRSESGLRLQLGAGVVQHVQARSDLWIGWQGGVAPYVVELVGQSGKRKRDLVVLNSVETPEHSTRIALPPSASGHLTLLVRDAQKTEARILLMTDTRVPMPPEELRTGAPTEAFARMLQALWLLRQPTRAWDLHAAAVASQAGDYEPATALLQMLADGGRPER